GTAGHLCRFLESALSKLRHQGDNMINKIDGGSGSYTEILGFGYVGLCVQVPGNEHKVYSVESNEQLSVTFKVFCAECLAAALD
ncbi:hypothetical protein TrRE_jg11694, partial [Triparma retinervis]